MPRSAIFSNPESPTPNPPLEGWHGWDEYARFYDWENRRTLGRRDVPFWQRLAAGSGGSVLELGCGTGRVSVPVAATGVRFVGVDRSSEMLRRARSRLRRARIDGRAAFVRGDIRRLPFGPLARFDLVIAPYGIVQSLVGDRDLAAALDSVARVMPSGALFGLDLVPDLPRWSEYRRRVMLHGRRGSAGPALTLIESVKQDRRRRLTIFEECYVEHRAGKRRVTEFSLVFRTLTVPQMARRLERAGYRIETVLGDYQGGPWDERADVWIILARRI